MKIYRAVQRRLEAHRRNRVKPRNRQRRQNRKVPHGLFGCRCPQRSVAKSRMEQLAKLQQPREGPGERESAKSDPVDKPNGNFTGFFDFVSLHFTSLRMTIHPFTLPMGVNRATGLLHSPDATMGELLPKAQTCVSAAHLLGRLFDGDNLCPRRSLPFPQADD